MFWRGNDFFFFFFFFFGGGGGGGMGAWGWGGYISPLILKTENSEVQVELVENLPPNYLPYHFVILPFQVSALV